MVEAAVGVIALITAVACVISGAYVYWIYSQRHEEALFLTRLVHRDIRVSGASALMAALIAWSYLTEPLPRPWGAVIIGVAVVLMMIGPISDALLWRKERRRAIGDKRPSAFEDLTPEQYTTKYGVDKFDDPKYDQDGA